MKLSVEMKVAAAVAAAFAALTVGAIAEANRGTKTNGLNGFEPTNLPTIKAQMRQRAYNNSVP